MAGCYARFEVLRLVVLCTKVFWDITTCCWVAVTGRFERVECLHLLDFELLKIKPLRSFGQSRKSKPGTRRLIRNALNTCWFNWQADLSAFAIKHGGTAAYLAAFRHSVSPWLTQICECASHYCYSRLTISFQKRANSKVRQKILQERKNIP